MLEGENVPGVFSGCSTTLSARSGLDLRFWLACARRHRLCRKASGVMAKSFA